MWWFLISIRVGLLEKEGAGDQLPPTGLVEPVGQGTSSLPPPPGRCNQWDRWNNCPVSFETFYCRISYNFTYYKNFKKEKVPNHIYNISNGPAQYFLLCLIFPLTLVSSSKNDDLMKIYLNSQGLTNIF